MTVLLIQNSTVLAQEPFDYDDTTITTYVNGRKDLTYQKDTIPGWYTVDTALPNDFLCSDYLWDGTHLVLKPSPAPSQDDKYAFIKQVDADVDDIYSSAVGNRLPEYDLANSEATAFAAAGYTGAIPGSVQAWATATGWSAQQAADDIISSAEKLSSARDSIRVNRLLAKENARRSETVGTLETVKQDWHSFVSNIKVQLGI